MTREFTLIWTLDAPPADVFQAWTDPITWTGSTTMPLDPDRLDESPFVTMTLSHAAGRTELILQVELPASMSEERMPEGWFGHIQDGWRETVDRLAASLSTASTST